MIQKSTCVYEENKKDFSVKRVKIFSVFFLTVAIIFSAYLSWVSLVQGGVAACGDGASCSEVLNSKWGKVLGLPIGLTGLFTYSFILLFLNKTAEGLKGFWVKATLVAMLLVPLAAIWFAIVQVFLLKAFCPWCCATHGFAMLGVGLLYMIRRKSLSQLPNAKTKKQKAKIAHLGAVSQPWTVPAVAVTALTGMIAVQAMSKAPEGDKVTEISPATLEPSKTEAEPNAARILSLHESEFELNLRDLPITGSPNAENVMVSISDYTCGHCRKLNEMLEVVQGAHGDDKLAIVKLPGMKNQKSLEIWRAVLPLWKIDRALYREVDETLYSNQFVVTPESVKALVEEKLGGSEAYLAAVAPHKKWSDKTIQQAVRLFNRNTKESGRRVIPQLMVGDEIVVGFSTAKDRYSKLVAKHFDLPLLPSQDSAASLDKEGLVEQKSDTGKTAPVLAQAAQNTPQSSPLSPSERTISQNEASLQVQSTKSSASNPKGVSVELLRDDHGLGYNHTKVRLAYSNIPSFGSALDSNLAVLVLDFYSARSRKEALRLIELRSTHEDAFSLALLAASPTTKAKELHQSLAALWVLDPEKYRLTIHELVKANRIPSHEEISQLVNSYPSLDVKQQAQVESYLVASQSLFLANRRIAGKVSTPHLLIGNELFTHQISSVSPLFTRAPRPINAFSKRLTKSP